MFEMRAFGSGTQAPTSERSQILTTREPQRMVRDEAVFAPAASPYAALELASKRLSAGLSVFPVLPTTTAEDKK